jgi:hypothetical protein
MFIIIRKCISTPEGWGGVMVLVVVVDVCITVDQLHDKMFCPSPPMTLELERASWTERACDPIFYLDLQL